MLRPFHFIQTGAGSRHSYQEKQNEQGKPDGLYCSVDVQDHLPDPAALEGLRRCGEKLPDFRQLFVPRVQCILEVLYYPVITHRPSPPESLYFFDFFIAASHYMIMFRISFVNVMMIPPASVRNPLARALGS